ncbi:MAG: DegT/DnrJ/EryC1/StrS family aminotransferase, partial [Gammaproteobacteria bacterium]|nr:DegT/DnrJ/EryC1/StrS family aminotransferase [Gammaproteobacteria bacterium]
MEKINFIDLKQQYLAYQTEIDQAIQGILDSSQFILGKPVTDFEQALAKFVDVPHVISCANGTDAIQLALMALDIKPGDEVITSVFSFIAAAEMIALMGAKPVFVDIDPRTYNIDPAQIADKITERTRAIIPVSLYGQIADLSAIQKVAEAASQCFGHQIVVIEDAAQSLGASYQGRQSGSFTTLATTSFFPSKPLGCYGDGGAIFTDNAAFAEKLICLRMHGEVRRYRHQYIGLNSRLDSIQAAVLEVKLKYFADEIEKRQVIAARYAQLLQHDAITLPIIAPGQQSVYAQYSVRVQHRAEVIAQLTKAGVPTAVHYPEPLHVQPCF